MREFELFLALAETVKLHNGLVIAGNTDQLKEILQLKAELEKELKVNYKVLSLDESLPHPEVSEDGTAFASAPVPQPPTPPEGFELFQTWATRMTAIQEEVQEQFIICKACPFFARKPGVIPCRVFPGTLEALCPTNYTCAMVEFNHWTKDDLYAKIKELGAKRGVREYTLAYKEDLEKLTPEKQEAFLKKIERRAASEALTRFRGKEESLIILSKNLRHDDLPVPEKDRQN